MAKKWITFDLDGTLMQNPFSEWVFPAIEQLANKYLIDGKGMVDELVQEHRNCLDAGHIVEAYDWEEIVAKVFADKGITEKVDVEKLVQLHAVPPKVYLLEDGVKEVLQKLKEKGFHLAAVTNGFEKYQKPVMDVLGLSDLFEVIITPEKVGFGKPQTEMVTSLFQNSDQVVAHVGDRLDHDVVLANTLGIMSVLVHRNMPEQLKAVIPSERVQMLGNLDWFIQKWQKETGKTEVPNHTLPDIVIHSIEEIDSASLVD